VRLLVRRLGPARSLVKASDWRYSLIVTEKLYYNDPGMLAFDASVLDMCEADGHYEIELDRTCFYPGGGGQPSDRGTLGGQQVIDVLTREDRIIHVVEHAVGPGTVHGQVDGMRRRDFMAQHTGQHIVSQALLRVGNLETVSVHFGYEDTTIELKAGSVDEKVLRAAEDLANGIIKENRRVVLHEIDRGEAHRFPLRRTPPDAGRLRIVEVQDFEWAACGGVHVSSTGEIFLVKVTSQERIRGRVRLHLMIGTRAFDDYGRKISILQDLSRDLTCGEEFLRARVQEVISREKDSVRELRRLQLGQAIADADDSVSAGRGLGGAVCVRRVFTSTGSEYLKAFVERVIATPGRICIAIDRSAESFQWMVAHSLGKGLELGDLVPALYPIADAKGGGRGDRMQGIGSVIEAVAQFADAIEAEIARRLEGNRP